MEIVSTKHIANFYLALFIGNLLILGTIFVIKIGIDENKNVLIITGIASLFMTLFMIYSYIKNAKKIILDKTGILFGKNKYYWKDIEEMHLTGKQKLFLSFEESTTLRFKNSDIIIIFDRLYSNSSDIKLFIDQVVIKQEDKIETPKKEKSDKHNLDRELFIPYKGNPVFSFRGIMMWGLIIPCLFFSPKDNYLFLSFFIVFILIWFIFNSFMMYYFEISKNYFVIRNHYFFWVKKVYKISNIAEIVYETQSKQPNKLRLITKDFKSKIFSAGSLSDKIWLEMKEELESKNIIVRNECI